LAYCVANRSHIEYSRKFVPALAGDEKMKENFDAVLEHVLKSEGGYSFHPDDPGGETMMGVTRAVYEQWVGRQVVEGEMKSLTFKDVAPIYKKEYWDRLRLDEAPAGLDMVLMDIGVNSGTGRAAKWIQRIAGVKADGAIGPVSIKAISKLNPQDTIERLYHTRQSFYERLKTFSTFGRGWSRRNKEVTEFAKELADG
tara:strand:- start:1878 stop:2471 length:594 start_codon:yes stop_codon:yes gene_type:complete